MTDMQTDVHVAPENKATTGGSSLVQTVKTTARLVPRQLNDQVELAKLELGDKKSRLTGAAIFTGLALVFLALLVIAMVVAAITGLGTIMPLWLAALIVCGAFLVVIGITALVAYLKVKALLPLLPEHAWRGIRHDVGVALHGRDFNPGTLDAEPLTREEKKARAAEAEAAKAKAKAEREAKEAEHGPSASTEELIKRTTVRREHLLDLREELVEEVDVKKQAGYLVREAKDKARETVQELADGAVGHATETLKERWKPLTVFAVSGAVALVLLRKLMKK